MVLVTVQDDQLAGLQICNYSAMAALAFSVWDIIIAFEQEVEQIWQGKWTRLKALYIFLRYFSVVAQIAATILTMGLATPLYPSRPICLLLMAFQAVSSQALMIGVQVLLVLRVIALYYGTRYLRRFLYTMFAIEIVSMTLFFGISLDGMDYGTHCVITGFPITATGFLIPPILFESLLFVLTMVKFYKALRDGWGRQPVISRFMSDGIWVFALPFVILTLNTLCMALLKGAMASVAYSWVIAIPPFAGARLILSMSHLLNTQATVTNIQTSNHSDQVLLDSAFLQITQPFTTMGYSMTTTTRQELTPHEYHTGIVEEGRLPSPHPYS